MQADSKHQTIFCRPPRIDLPFHWTTANLLFGVNEIQSGCIYGFVGRACRETPRSGSQRSGFLARDLPNRSRPSCITSYIIGGRACEDWLSRVSETKRYRGSTRSGSGRDGERQARSCISLSQPSSGDGDKCSRGRATLMLEQIVVPLITVRLVHCTQRGQVRYAVIFTAGATLREQQPSKRLLHLRQRCRRRISISLPYRTIVCQGSRGPSCRFWL